MTKSYNNITMKKIFGAAVAFILLCTNCSQTPGDKNPIDMNKQTIDSDRLTPEVMWKLGRTGQIALSPDKQKIAFTITYTDIAEDKSYADIYTINADGTGIRRITDTKENEYQVGWTPDGEKIAYLAARGEDPQVWTIDKDGNNREQVTKIADGVESFRYSPDGKKLIITKRVKLDETVNDRYPDLPKANARIETDLMYRHWNDWADYKYSHVMYVNLKDGKQDGEVKDIMEGEKYHSPLMPFGGIEQVMWTPDSKQIAYTCKKLQGKASAFSTNSDIYLYDIETGSTKNLTEGNMGYDQNPQFSADGKKMFYQSMEHDGFESDKNRLMMLDLASGERTDLTAKTEHNVDAFAIADDEESVWVIMDEEAKDEIFNIKIADGTISKITNEECDYTSVVEAGDKLIATRMSMKAPSEIYSVDKTIGEAKNISKVNEEALSKIKMGDVEERWIETTDGKKMLVWVIYPPEFDKTKKYPALLYCQGGPQSTVSQFWSTRWNFELMAANGYIVVAPNRRGLPGFGREWNDEISGDYGGQCMRDYFSAIDAVAAEPYVDEERLGAVGASFGGYSIYWLAGNHEKRFKAFIAHCGIFNFEAMYPETEEMFFVNWDMKGAPWDKNNAAAMSSYANSPHLFVNNWDTPIMVIHGEKDFRIPYTQGMAAFNTAICKGIEAEFLYFPDECHWVNKPQNSILWHREFFRWLDKHLK